jgi:DNA repair exonuclease SbcCD ATPase subunit
MKNSISEKILIMSEKAKSEDKLKNRLENARQNLQREKTRLADFKRILEKEEADVKKLEGFNLTVLFLNILGNKESQMDKERQEYLSAKLKHDQICNTISSIEAEVVQLSQELLEIKSIQIELRNLMNEKQKMMMEANNEHSEKLTELTEKLLQADVRIKELNEAIIAGKKVENVLDKIIEALRSAKDWGTWDMLGGGFIATAVKHSKIDNAKGYIYEAQTYLRKFQQELKDVDIATSVNVEIGEFETFADYFFDGLISDWIVQSKIKSSLEDTVSLNKKVYKILQQLERDLKQVHTERENINYEIGRIVGMC